MTYTCAARARLWKPEEDRSVYKRRTFLTLRTAPSLHGLLIPNFADNGRELRLFFSFFLFFFFYADTLVERRTPGVWGTLARVDFAPAGT